jgi:hypothetical protein
MAGRRGRFSRPHESYMGGAEPPERMLLPAIAAPAAQGQRLRRRAFGSRLLPVGWGSAAPAAAAPPPG